MPSVSTTTSKGPVSFANLPDNAVKFVGSKSEIETLSAVFFKLDIKCDPSYKLQVWLENGEINIGETTQGLKRYQPPSDVMVEYEGEKHSFDVSGSGKRIAIHTQKVPDNAAGVPLSPLLVPLLGDILTYRELRSKQFSAGDTEAQADNVRKLREVAERIKNRYEEEKQKAKEAADAASAPAPKPKKPAAASTAPAHRPTPRPKPAPAPAPVSQSSHYYSSYSG